MARLRLTSDRSIDGILVGLTMAMFPDWTYIDCLSVYSLSWRVGEELASANVADWDNIARFHGRYFL